MLRPDEAPAAGVPGHPGLPAQPPGPAPDLRRLPRADRGDQSQRGSWSRDRVLTSDWLQVDQEIVDFVMAELSYGDCARNSLAVTNFQSQVVAGLRYKFDLEAVASAQCGDGAAESCHVEVSIDCMRIICWIQIL